VTADEQRGGESAAFFRRQFAIDDQIIAELLGVALERGGEYAELYFEQRESGNIVFEEQRVKNVGGGLMQGLGVRVVSGDAIGYAYTEDLSRETMRRAAATAAHISDRGDRVAPVSVAPQTAAQFYPVVTAAVEAQAADKLALIRRADNAARSYDPSIVRVDIGFFDETKHVLVATSDGRLSGDVQPMLRFNVTCLSEVEGNRQTATSGGGGRVGMEYFGTHEPGGIAREAARQAVLLQSAQEAPAGPMPVVLGPGDAGVLLHEAVGHGLEADFNRKKTSNYSDRVGDSVASELCTVVDDGTIINSRGSINIDDEGNPGRTNTLIERGVLRGYMQDRISSLHFHVGPTGNSRRESFRHYPMPRMTNTYMLAGETPPEDVIRAVDRGIYCASFSGGQVNISNGDFVFSVTEGYLIEQGHITAPIRTVNLIGNGPDVLSKVRLVGTDFRLSDGRWTCGKDGQSVPVGVGMPTVLVSEITVGGTKRIEGI
jgi:TldD protein